MTGPAPIEPLCEALRDAFDAMPDEFRGDVVCAIDYARAVYRMREQAARALGKPVATEHWRVRAECMELVAAAFGLMVRAPVAAILGDFEVKQ